ncbi:MAG: hypothetical protein AAF958_01365 [Planctomycetota bacterium]
MKKAAKKKRATTRKVPDVEALQRYETLFGELMRFVEVIEESETELADAQRDVVDLKSKYDAARDRVREIKELRDGAERGLFRYLRPADGSEVLPLFDRMEPASEERHGVNSDEWRSRPVAALKLSLPAQVALTDVGILMVGQLQDRVLDDAESWYEKLEGVTAGMAAAIVDRLNEFIFDEGAK